MSTDRVFTAPLGSATCGRIVFTTSVPGLTLLTGPALHGLVRGRFMHRLSWVGFEKGSVMIGTYPCSGPGEPGDEITLNGSIPWEIEFRGAISDLNADLRGLDLRSLDVLGGASQIRLLLSKPAGTAFLYITGGIRDGTIHIPPGFGVRVQASGGVHNLVFEGQHYAALRGDINLENSTFNSAISRCDICIAGGASDLTLDV